MMKHSKIYDSTTAAQKRRLQAYPPPRVHSLLVAYSVFYEVRKSEIVSTAIKEFFDRMPASDRERILKQYEDSKTVNNSE